MKYKLLILMLSCFGAMGQTANRLWFQPISGHGIKVQLLDEDGITNLSFNTNYTGTIQVGTNFYTVKDLQNGILIVPSAKTPPAFLLIPMPYFPSDTSPFKN